MTAPRQGSNNSFAENAAYSPASVPICCCAWSISAR